MPLSSTIQDYVNRNIFTFDEANNLTHNQLMALESQTIRGLIADGTITINQALQFNFEQRMALEGQTIGDLIVNGTITVEQVLQFNDDQCMALSTRHIVELINDGIITINQALQFNFDDLLTLANNDIRERLRNGELTIQDIMDNQNGEQGIPVPVNLNNAQSTHTASVHRTVSESATRLFNRYTTTMSPEALDSIISNIIETINALPDGNQKNEAAKRCAARLASPDYTYTDPGSGVNTRELLGLIWLAIHDDTTRIGSLADAMHQFIEGLYETQRGYNLSATGVDLRGSDIFICFGGTFNKLLEKLNSVCPDVVIEFITPELASIKLPIVVREEVKNYLAVRANPSTVGELTQFTQQVKQIEEEGIETIWEAIKDKVEDRIFDEFGSLYANQHDPRFKEFIDAGNYTEPGNLSFFQKEIFESKGYRKYCSTIMKSSYRLFSQKQPLDASDDLSDTDTNRPKLT